MRGALLFLCLAGCQTSHVTLSLPLVSGTVIHADGQREQSGDTHFLRAEVTTGKDWLQVGCRVEEGRNDLGADHSDRFPNGFENEYTELGAVVRYYLPSAKGDVFLGDVLRMYGEFGAGFRYSDRGDGSTLSGGVGLEWKNVRTCIEYRWADTGAVETGEFALVFGVTF